VKVKVDIVLAGVGGQGVLSLAGIIAHSAMKEGLEVKQSEVHGMSQRGGAVMAHLRIADGPIYSDIIGRGDADMILAMEPVESLRYLDYLAKGGTVITNTAPVVNIPDYPDLEAFLERVRALPQTVLVDAERLAKAAGSPRAANMVLVGAASHLLPVSLETIRRAVEELFSAKGAEVVRVNLEALRLGREAFEHASARR
jgi:indolepyruvate ferredoxin oxidoreductase beta subunit